MGWSPQMQTAVSSSLELCGVGVGVRIDGQLSWLARDWGTFQDFQC